MEKARKKRRKKQRFLRAFFFIFPNKRVVSNKIMSGSEVSQGEIYGNYMTGNEKQSLVSPAP